MLTPDVTGLPGAKYSLNAVMRVRLGPYKEGETPRGVVSPGQQAVCAGQGGGPPRKLPAGALAVSVQPPEPEKIKLVLFQRPRPGVML